ncbi:hypothetical protein EV182_008340, partial [Spiromyces aspiralis]
MLSSDEDEDKNEGEDDDYVPIGVDDIWSGPNSPRTSRSSLRSVKVGKPTGAADDNLAWVQELRLKLQEALKLSESTKTATTTYQRLLSKDKDLDEQFEKLRKKAVLPSLPENTDAIIREALSAQLVTEKFNIAITGYDLSTLSGSNWLNDE